MKKLIVFTFLSILIVNLSCRQKSFSSSQLAYQSNSNTNNYSNSNVDVRQPESKESALLYPTILYGNYLTADARIKNQMSVNVTVSDEDIRSTVSRGFAVNLPPVGTTVEMDILNCSGYLGTAKVTYQGLQNTAWTAEMIPETKVSDVEQRLLRCVADPNDEFTRKYLSNSVFFIAPKNEKRKQIKNVQKPDWKQIVSSIPYEWRKVARLPKFPTEKQATQCIGEWLDSDGDGNIDIITLCAFNEDSITESGNVWEYSRVLRLVDGQWREIWQTADTKD